jgi:hypothetical protein
LTGAFVYPLIGDLIALTVVALWFAGVIQKLYVISEVIEVVLMLLVAFSVAISAYLTVRCIFSLAVVSRINKKDFWCHTGQITYLGPLWSSFLRLDLYYVVDDEYCSRAFLDPFYIKKSEVYFLYFPVFLRGSLMGGVVVRKKE